MFPYGQPITLLAETRDRVGDVTLTEDGTVAGCAWAPRTTSSSVHGSTEEQRRRMQVTTGLTLFAPSGSGITASHRVRLPDGSVWSVIGDPGDWRSPYSGWAPGQQVELERVKG
jgi:hypothetical protein